MKSSISKILAVLLILVCLFGCGGEETSSNPYVSKAGEANNPDGISLVSEVPARLNYNNLTGCYDLENVAVGKRPVAVMINNYSSAQAVQTGLNSADIVFESLAEGGISRLMAVFSDITGVGQIGTVRSARYSYVQIAYSLDCVYVHCGMDDIYTRPYAKEIGISFFDLGARGASFREKNGLAYEHTLYTSGEKLTKGINDADFRTNIKESANKTFCEFNDPDAPVTSAAACKKVSYAMSQSYKTDFVYDEEKAMYNRMPLGNSHLDYKTGEQTHVKNVLVLFASYSNFSDNYHVKADLSSGSGYYVSNGGYSEIKWSKGGASERFSFTDASGAALKMNAGSTWAAIVPTSMKSSVTL